VTFQSFDSLDRLSSIQNMGVTSFIYDSHDRPLAVVGPNNDTQFVYDGFGNLIQQTSPDSGKTTLARDRTLGVRSWLNRT
jgi:YD repeat-containing protein